MVVHLRLQGQCCGATGCRVATVRVAGLRMRRANVGEESRNAAAALPCPDVQWRLPLRTGCGRSPAACYSARRGPRPAGRYASPSMVTLRAGRYINVPAFVAVRLTLRRFRNGPLCRYVSCSSGRLWNRCTRSSDWWVVLARSSKRSGIGCSAIALAGAFGRSRPSSKPFPRFLSRGPVAAPSIRFGAEACGGTPCPATTEQRTNR